MKQKLYFFILLTLAVGMILSGCSQSPDVETAEPNTPNTPAEETSPTNTQPAAPAEPASSTDLPKLPAIVQNSAPAPGIGGGGGAETAVLSPLPAAESAIVADDLMIEPGFYTDIFSGTLFTLNAALPTEPTQALVQQQTTFTIDEATAQQLAAQLGFSGSLYVPYYQPFPEQLDVVESDAAPFEQPSVYYAFNGTEILTIDGFGVYYRDEAIDYNVTNQLSVADRTQIAEAFLQERGLLTFPYTVEPGWGGDLFFKRTIDGYTLNQPEIIVTVNDDGTVPFMSYNVLTNLEVVGNYPLRTAEEAWNLILDGVQKNDIVYNWLPTDDDLARQFDDAPEVVEQYQYWERHYAPGEEAHIYGWPNIYMPANGEGAPRIEMYPYVLAGDTAVLQEIANTQDTMIHIWGTAAADNKTITVTGWESLPEPQTLYLDGVIRRSENQVQLITTDREIYILPNAPEDLPNDLSVYVYAWGTQDSGQGHPALIWQSIEQRFDPSEQPGEGIALPEPMPIEEPGFSMPQTYATFTVDSVSLAYYYMPVYPAYEDGVEETQLVYSPPPVMLLPVWQFVGTADTGERLELLVSAAAPDYLQAP